VIAAIALATGGLTVPAHAQVAETPVFTASIKRNLSGAPGDSLNVQPGGRLFITNHSLHKLLRIVFQVQDGQLIGGPAWLSSDRWDIVATAGTQVSEFQMIGMLRTLITDRFKLVTHRERREVPVFALTIGSTGLKTDFRRSTNDCRIRSTCNLNQGRGEIRGTGQTLGSIRRALEQASGRIIVDRTDLPGLSADNVAVLYDIRLRWRPDGATDFNNELPSLFTAVEEQLGLKLQADRSPVDVVVIDALERPAEE
jgi:uncharacterized protein (TIGR03435 family)